MPAIRPERWLRWAAPSACLLLALACFAGGGEDRTLVLEVFDGDTILVRLPGGGVEKVRLLGVDAPETEGYRDAEPGGEEAAAFARDLMGGANVVLEADPLADDRDRYGRLLRYVRLPDGRDAGLAIIEAGYAEAYRRFPFERRDDYLRREEQARVEGRGLWAARERSSPER